MKIEKISIQEEEVMRCVWQLGRCNIKAIVDLLPSPTPPYTTVASVVGNLKRKGYVIAQRKGNGFESGLASSHVFSFPKYLFESVPVSSLQGFSITPYRFHYLKIILTNHTHADVSD